MDETLKRHLETLKKDAPEVYRVITAVLGQASAPTPPTQHSDDAAVDRFAAALKMKLAQEP